MNWLGFEHEYEYVVHNIQHNKQFDNNNAGTDHDGRSCDNNDVGQYDIAGTGNDDLQPTASTSHHDAVSSRDDNRRCDNPVASDKHIQQFIHVVQFHQFDIVQQ